MVVITLLKRTVVQCFYLSFLCIGAFYSQADSSSGRILVMGDSISSGFGMALEQGWVHLLEERLHDIDVINASISGETTKGGRARLPETIARNKPDIIIIQLGGNDALRGYPLAKIRANIRQMINYGLATDAIVLLMEMRIPPNYGRYATGFQAIYKKLARETNVTMIPFFLDNVATNPELMQFDGIHPKVEAQPIILDNVWPYIKDLL